MSWQSIIKEIPEPKSIDGVLANTGGVAYITRQFEEALASGAKKNFRATRKRIDALAAGDAEGVPTSILDEGLVNAKELKDNIDEMMEGNKLDAQGKAPGPRTTPKITDDTLQAAVEEYNDDNPNALIEWLGDNNRDRHAKKRIKLVKDNRRALSELPKSDTKLYYYTLKGVRFVTDDTATLDSGAYELDDRIREKLKPFDVQFEDTEINPPERMAYDDYNDLIRELESLSREKIAVYKKVGTAVPSILVAALGTDPTGSLEDAVEQFSFERHGKQYEYRSNVTTKQQVLSYFKLMTTKGWRKPIFMPDSIISRSADSRAMQSILGSKTRPRVSPTLNAVLSSEKFNLNDMLEVGETAKVEIPPYIRRYLQKPYTEVSSEVLKNAELVTDDIDDMRERFEASNKEYPRFIRWLNGKGRFRNSKNEIITADQLRVKFDALLQSILTPQQNLFSTEEKEFLVALKGKSQGDVIDEIADFYGVTEEVVRMGGVGRAARRIVRNNEPFIEVSDGFHKVNTKIKISHKDLRNFISGMRKYRKTKYSVETPLDSVSDIDTLKDVFDEDFEVDKTSVNSASIIKLILTINRYYRRGRLSEMENEYYDGEVELKELLESIEQEYSQIVDSLVNATDNKIKRIITNRQDYLEAMAYSTKTGSKRYRDALREGETRASRRVKNDPSKQRRYDILGKLKDNNLVTLINLEEEE